MFNNFIPTLTEQETRGPVIGSPLPKETYRGGSFMLTVLTRLTFKEGPFVVQWYVLHTLLRSRTEQIMHR
jgi:hypothetical protein